MSATINVLLHLTQGVYKHTLGQLI